MKFFIEALILSILETSAGIIIIVNKVVVFNPILLTVVIFVGVIAISLIVAGIFFEVKDKNNEIKKIKIENLQKSFEQLKDSSRYTVDFYKSYAQAIENI